MLWAISRVTAPNFAPLREKYLQAHLDFLKSQKRILVLSGATTSDDGQEFTGSLLIINVGSRAQAKAFADGDPFAQAGMVRDVQIKRMRKGQWNPEAAEGV